MGWIRDGAEQHEGWVANVLADGRVSASSTSEGAVVHELTAGDVAAGYEVRRYPGSDYLDVVVPWRKVTRWRVTCSCGWTGSERRAVTETEYGTRDCPEAFQERHFLPEWRAHVAPFAALADLERLLEQARDLDSRAADAVRVARSGGASWTQIGRAAGLSKQGAQQRWG
jgi:hypothetical protein